MKPCLQVIFVLVVVLAAGARSSAADNEVTSILNKAIEAVGGGETLEKAEAIEWKSKGVVVLNGFECEFAARTTIASLDKFRSEFEIRIDDDGDPVKTAFVVNGKDAWHVLEGLSVPLDNEALAEAQRGILLQIVPVRLALLRRPEFKLQAVPETEVNERRATGIKVTGPAGKDFTVLFDKETGLPVRTLSRVRKGDSVEITNLTDYRELGGIRKAARIELQEPEGTLVLKQEIVALKILEKLPADTFATPTQQ